MIVEAEVKFYFGVIRKIKFQNTFSTFVRIKIIVKCIIASFHQKLVTSSIHPLLTPSFHRNAELAMRFPYKKKLRQQMSVH